MKVKNTFKSFDSFVPYNSPYHLYHHFRRYLQETWIGEIKKIAMSHTASKSSLAWNPGIFLIPNLGIFTLYHFVHTVFKRKTVTSAI